MEINTELFLMVAWYRWVWEDYHLVSCAPAKRFVGKLIDHSSTIIAHFLDNPSDIHPGTVVVYYFFDFSDPEKQTAGSFVRSCLSQLCQSCPTSEIPPDLVLYFEECERKKVTPWSGRPLYFMRLMMRLFPSVVIVIDAIDECRDLEDRKFGILAVVEEMLDWNNPKQHIIVASRRYTLLYDDLASRFTSSLSIEGDEHKADIDSYINKRLNIGRLKKISDGSQNLDIAKKLKDSAGNM